MSPPKAAKRKPSLLADRAPDRRRTRRTEPGSRDAKAFYRAPLDFTAADFLDTKIVPGYN